MGYQFYKQELGVLVVRASREVYFDQLVVKSYLAHLQHGWLSATAKAEAYNAIFC